jgi:hypothetical protein
VITVIERSLAGVQLFIKLLLQVCVRDYS